MSKRVSDGYVSRCRVTRKQNFIICVKAGKQDWNVWKEYLGSRRLKRRDWKNEEAKANIKALGSLIIYGYLREQGGEGMPIAVKDLIVTWWIPPTSYYYLLDKNYWFDSEKPWRKYKIKPRWDVTKLGKKCNCNCHCH